MANPQALCAFSEPSPYSEGDGENRQAPRRRPPSNAEVSKRMEDPLRDGAEVMRLRPATQTYCARFI